MLYQPEHFAVDDDVLARRVMDEAPFATLITPAAPTPWISHLPLLWDAPSEDAPLGALVGHLAAANEHLAALFDGDSVAIFNGPHAYVSPTWYPEPAGMVPTWNYVVLHAHGRAQRLDDAGCERVLRALTARFEQGPDAWRLTLPPDALARMLKQIVGFRLPITSRDLKLKLSQNRTPTQHAGVASHLAAGDADAQRVADWMIDIGLPRAPG